MDEDVPSGTGDDSNDAEEFSINRRRTRPQRQQLSSTTSIENTDRDRNCSVASDNNQWKLDLGSGQTEEAQQHSCTNHSDCTDVRDDDENVPNSDWRRSSNLVVEVVEDFVGDREGWMRCSCADDDVHSSC